MKITIPGRLPGMNEIIKAAKIHHMKYANMKKKHTEEIMDLITVSKIKATGTSRELEYYHKGQVDINITWHCSNQKRDPDNIIAGTKFILDALQTSGVIQNDNWKGIGKITHDVRLDRKNPRIEVELIPVEVDVNDM